MTGQICNSLSSLKIKLSLKTYDIFIHIITKYYILQQLYGLILTTFYGTF